MEKQFDNASVVVTFRVSLEENKALLLAGKMSGRTRADVMRRLARLVDNPAGRAVLGIIEDKPIEYAWKAE